MLPKFKQFFKVIVLLCFISVLCQPFFTHSAQPSVSSLAKMMYKFAEGELPRILERIPMDKEEGYGFNNRAEFKKAALGIPYQEFSLATEKATGYWRIPVTVDGENRALLRLLEVNGQWTFAGFGAARLARELEFFENNVAETMPTWGRIVRDFDMQCDYLQFEPKSLTQLDRILHPMESAARILLRTYPQIDSGGYPVPEIKKLRLRLKAIAGAGGKDISRVN